MESINQLSYVLQYAILIGLGARIVYICTRLTHEDEEVARYKKRLKNTLIFAIISQLPFVIKDIIFSYFT